jgi:hypothetical protein
MDYSLLIGMHYSQFKIHRVELHQLKNKEASSHTIVNNNLESALKLNFESERKQATTSDVLYSSAPSNNLHSSMNLSLGIHHMPQKLRKRSNDLIRVSSNTSQRQTLRESMSCEEDDELLPREDFCDETKNRFSADFVSGPSAYYIGIIDILQQWTISKQMERMYKVHVLRKDPRGISAISPKQYAKRFQMKMCQLLYQPSANEH